VLGATPTAPDPDAYPRGDEGEVGWGHSK